ncbi:uncharacterized protein [Oscarella lobularis]|uniref:uncharacterized protein n=1 Tax=Oscarella lobularis TaxID=121494 RepID=UPI0033137F61
MPHRLFAKGVSDLGTPRSKMDYYQPYCAASAMAVVCHLFKGRDFFFPKSKAPVPAPPEKPASGDTIQPTPHDGLPSDKTEVDDNVALAVSKVADEFWEGIANTLKVNTLNINYRTADVNLYHVIKNWRLAATTTPTVGELLKACSLNGVDRLAIAAKYKQIKSIIS